MVFTGILNNPTINVLDSIICGYNSGYRASVEFAPMLTPAKEARLLRFPPIAPILPPSSNPLVKSCNPVSNGFLSSINPLPVPNTPPEAKPEAAPAPISCESLRPIDF